MSSIHNIIGKQIQQYNENICFAFDCSGSTRAEYKGKLNENNESGFNTVLDKECDILREMIDTLPNNIKSYITIFSEYATPLQEIIKPDGEFEFPKFKPYGRTNTNLAFKQILSYPELNIKRVIVITDGLSNSLKNDLSKSFEQFKLSKTSVEVIGVTTLSRDFNTISVENENEIPGVDLFTNSKGIVDYIKIYSSIYNDIPFYLYRSFKNSQKTLLGFKIHHVNSVTYNINKIVYLIKLKRNKWGEDCNDLRMFLAEIGGIIALRFPTFIKTNFVRSIISTFVDVSPLSHDKIYDMLFYGFTCVKNSIPISMVRIIQRDKHVKILTKR